MYRIIQLSLYAVFKFVVLLFGLFLIYKYIDSIEIHATTDSLGGEGAGLAFIGFILALLWLSIWYIPIFYFLKKTRERKDTYAYRLNLIVSYLPGISLIIWCLWVFVLHPLYFNFRQSQITERHKRIYEYIINGEQTEALSLINAGKTYNLRFDNITLLTVAAKNDDVVFDSLLDRMDYMEKRLISNNDNNGNCLFCYLQNENSADNAIDKIEFENKYWKNSIKPAFCDDKDLLLFFIQKRWYRCIDKYLAKVSEPKAKYTNELILYKYYNCQVKLFDPSGKFTGYQTVDPYSYTSDSSAILILNKYVFIEQ
jgi:hypothetical protein